MLLPFQQLSSRLYPLPDYSTQPARHLLNSSFAPEPTQAKTRRMILGWWTMEMVVVLFEQAADWSSWVTVRKNEANLQSVDSQERNSQGLSVEARGRRLSTTAKVITRANIIRRIQHE